ncbi:MAG: hypothetical protein HYV97_06420 [Bdellovibrio sp.]|nr:hypothetical protein [Bdellovibrio sp.]
MKNKIGFRIKATFDESMPNFDGSVKSSFSELAESADLIELKITYKVLANPDLLNSLLFLSVFA